MEIHKDARNEQEQNERMDKLISAVGEAFPQKDGGFNSAVFIHHDKDGNLKSCSPLIGEAKGSNTLGVRLLVERLLIYSDACRTMANEIINKTLPGN